MEIRPLRLKHFGQWREVGEGQVLWGLGDCDKMFDCYSNGEGKLMEGFKQGGRKGFTNLLKEDFLFYFIMKIEAARRNFTLIPANLVTHLLVCAHLPHLPNCN